MEREKPMQDKTENDVTCMTPLSDAEDATNDSTRVNLCGLCIAFFNKFLQNRTFRTNVLYTASIYSVYFAMGWQFAQIGPAFQDLQMICGVDLERGSWIITSSSIGYAIGSIIGGGWLYKKMNPKLFFCVLQIILGCTYLIIPWCVVFWAMICMYLFQGGLQGALEPVGYVEILSIWKTNGRTIFIGLNFIYCLGGILSPLATAPFLFETKQDNDSVFSINNNTIPHLNMSETSAKHPENFVNATLKEISQHKQESMLYIAFSMSGVISFVVAAGFGLTLCSISKNSSAVKKKDEHLTTKTNTSRCIRYTMLILMGVMFCFSTGIDEVFLYYLSVFCIKYFDWETRKSALIMSVLYIASIVSALLGVILVKFQGPVFLSGMSVTIGFLSLIGFLLSSITFWQPGIWLCATLQSFAKMNFTSFLFTWTNDYITPVSGRLSSYYVLSNMVGNSLNPLLVGYLMEEKATVWFAYLFMIEAGVLFFIYIVTAVLTKCFLRQLSTVRKDLDILAGEDTSHLDDK